FFSSRGRHTSFSRDWSSDVCSSDLVDDHALAVDHAERAGFQRGQHAARIVTAGDPEALDRVDAGLEVAGKAGDLARIERGPRRPGRKRGGEGQGGRGARLAGSVDAR